MANIRQLEIRLHGRPIGNITRLASDQHVFGFDEAYLVDEDRDTLSLSFKRRGGGLLETTRTVRQRLPEFFSNLLPEGHLRQYIAEKVGVHADREFALLAYLGQDLPGAITAVPVGDDGSTSTGADPGTADADADEGALRFSLAGVQLKFSAVMEANGGLTIPADGIGGKWIVKLPSNTYPSVPENEYAMMELARAVGIEVPDISLVPIDSIKGLPAPAANMEGRALIVRRFDRAAEGGLVHIEDFAQVFSIFPSEKYRHRSYANIAAVIAAECGSGAAEDFFRRIVFTTFIGNGDMHLKNWSLIYRDRKIPSLAPAYDYVATLPYIPGDSHGLSFGKSKDLHTITRDQVRRFADTAGLAPAPLWSIVEEAIETIPVAWKTHEPRAALSGQLDDAIDQHIGAVAIAIGSQS
ncbi:MAG: type II toxin-antitoxin system HipA family toxin [Alphaproteobacteria bacterium]|nr:type II toxin-antitoxin system HipA family toxin [Alphaproteobacteria bacterium]